MPKSLLTILTALSLLLAAMVLGQARGPAGSEAPARTIVTSARPSAPPHRIQHVSFHDRTAIDDDDVYDDDDDDDDVVLAPRPHDNQKEVASDATSDEGDRAAHPDPFATDGSRWPAGAIRPSGEHRSAADRPPRS